MGGVREEKRAGGRGRRLKREKENMKKVRSNKRSGRERGMRVKERRKSELLSLFFSKVAWRHP